MRALAFTGDESLERRAARDLLELACLIVQPLERAKLLLATELSLLHGGFHDTDRFVIDLDRHRKRVAVLAAVRQREARRIAKPAGCAMHDLGHHRQRLD